MGYSNTKYFQEKGRKRAYQYAGTFLDKRDALSQAIKFKQQNGSRYQIIKHNKGTKGTFYVLWIRWGLARTKEISY